MITYFQTQGVVMPGLIANVFGIGVTMVLNLVLIHGTTSFGSDRWAGYGFIGSAIGTLSLARRWVQAVRVLALGCAEYLCVFVHQRHPSLRGLSWPCTAGTPSHGSATTRRRGLAGTRAS